MDNQPLLPDCSILGYDTDRGGRKRDVQTNIVFHVALLRVSGSEGDRATSVIRNHPISEEARDEVIHRAQQGEKMTEAKIKRIIADANDAARKKTEQQIARIHEDYEEEVSRLNSCTRPSASR